MFYGHILFKNNAVTCVFDIGIRLGKSEENEYHSEARCTSEYMRFLQ